MAQDGTVNEQDLRQAIDSALRAKSKFLAAASHDLRQPFQAMRFFHSVLAGQVGGDARRTLEMLGRAMGAGERLLDALLDISTLDAGTVEPRPERFALHEMLDRLVQEFRPQAEAKGLSLRAHVRPLDVVSDPVLFERILRNLVANAVRYTRRGGVLLGMRRRGARGRVEIWDTGFGFAPGQRDSIFEEFVQLENPERDRDRGLGLGLAIVRRLATLLGTPVDVESRPGRGSVFGVSVPLAEESEVVSESQKNGPAADLAGRTVLVVDDDAMVLMGLQMIMETWGCVVLDAEDMAGVLRRLDEGVPEVVLTDLRLRGGVTGFDVVERVNSVLRRTVPAVVLTGETGEKELAEGHRRGVTFLHKPIQADLLRTALAEALATRQ